MDYARAIGQRDVAVGYYAIAVFVAVICAVQRRIVRADELFALKAFYDGMRLEMLSDKLLSQNISVFNAVLFRLDKHVIVFGIYAQRDVGRERPGRSRPGEEEAPALEVGLEPDDGGLFRNVLIALRDLVRRERRSATRAVRHYLMPFVDKPAVEYGL